jgi:hypothetical protein
MDGANRFITVSARFGTPLAPRCRELFDALQDSRARHLAFQANAMATLPVATRAPKRPKAEMQDDSAPAAAESQDVDDAELDRITAYLTSLRLEEESKAVEDKFCNAVAQGIAAIGTARWLQVRLDGRTKMSAYRAFVSFILCEYG